MTTISTDVSLIAGALGLPVSVVATWGTDRLRDGAWEALRICEGKCEIAQRERDALLATWQRLKSSAGGAP